LLSIGAVATVRSSEFAVYRGTKF